MIDYTPNFTTDAIVFAGEAYHNVLEYLKWIENYLFGQVLLDKN